MTTILRAIVLACCLAAFSVAAGGHWALLQTVAWTRMAVDYTRDTGSVREGLARTFDGAHPCELCHKISAGFTKENRDQQSSKQETAGKGKLTAVMPSSFCHVVARVSQTVVTPSAPRLGKIAEAPPVPPPRET